MKASDAIESLQSLINEHGDCELMIRKEFDFVEVGFVTNRSIRDDNDNDNAQLVFVID